MRRPRRVIAGMLSLLLALLCADGLWCACASPAATASPAASTMAAAPVSDQFDSSNHHQIVLVVKFSDTNAESLNGKLVETGNTFWKNLLDDLRREEPDSLSPSLRYYLQVISGGKYNLSSEAPQSLDNDARVAYLTLPQTRASYTGNSGHVSVASDAIRLFNETYPDFDASRFNTGDGSTLDNLLLLVDVGGSGAPTTSADPLWPKKDQLGSTGSVNKIGKAGKQATVNTFTIIPVTQGGLIATGTIAHEYLHTLGAKDLYRQERALGGQATSKTPVGVMWDIMAGSQGNFFSWPLAQTLHDAGLGPAIEEAPAKTATYTLHEHGSGQQALVFKTPRSSSEYFVVEYRKLSTSPRRSLDDRIGGSGLVVYRVNTPYRQDGNKGDKDYIYMFRSDETGIMDSAGDIKNA